ncbi:MAG: hypothetical protein LUI05_00935 [Oscillospiraceae bacterium]|nr:hypothetical protein [Oscillospiraceae bacterium]
MDRALLLEICSIYNHSKLPTLIASHDCIWENDGFSKRFGIWGAEEKDRLIEILRFSEGERCVMIGGSIVTFNVVKGDGVVIAEVIECEDSEKLFAVPSINEYLAYFFARLRSSVLSISAQADGIYNTIASGGGGNCGGLIDKLNAIDSSLSDIISMALDPEQLLFLKNDNTKTSTVSLRDELQSMINEFKSLLEERVPVKSNLESGIYAILNRPAFKVIIFDIFERCCRKFTPNSLEVVLHRLSENGAEILVIADYSSEKPPSCPNESIQGEFFFDYLVESFCRRYGGAFTLQSLKHGERYSIAFPTVYNPKPEVSANICFMDGAPHFGAAQIRLGRLADNKRYKPFPCWHKTE